MGAVHLARHVETGVEYAIKSVPLAVDPELRLRFQREAEAQAAIDGHPNVAKVHASGVGAGRAYIVMELLRGGDLKARLRDGPLPPEQAAEWVRQLALGLAHVHRAGILHRDLKPENVLFDEQERPKLADFGLARRGDRSSLTETGAVMGTPAYMAPEQVEGLQDQLDARVDLYGLGAVLYHALSGGPPFRGPVMKVLHDVLTREPPPLPRTVPARLAAICRQAMAKAPEDRHPDGQALADDLAAFLADPSGGPPRNPWPIFGLVLLVLVAVAIALGRMQPVRTVTAPAPTETKSLPDPTPTSAPAPTGTASPKTTSKPMTHRSIPIGLPKGIWTAAVWIDEQRFVTFSADGRYRAWALHGDRCTAAGDWFPRRPRYNGSERIAVAFRYANDLFVGGETHPLTRYRASGGTIRPGAPIQTRIRPRVGLRIGSTLYYVEQKRAELRAASMDDLRGIPVLDLSKGSDDLRIEHLTETPDQRLAVVVGMKGKSWVRVYRPGGIAEPLTQMATCKVPDEWRSVAFRSGLAVAGNKTGSLFLLDGRTLQTEGDLVRRQALSGETPGNRGAVQDLVFLTRRRFLALGSHATRNDLVLYDLRDRRVLQRIDFSGRVWSIALSPDRRHAIVSGSSGSLNLIRFNTE